MEIQRALTLGRALTDGVNPENGEVPAAAAPYQYAPVVRAHSRAVGTWKILRERESTRRTRPRSRTRS